MISFILILALFTFGVNTQESEEDIIVGKSVKFYSKIYDNDIKLSIYLPSDYSSSNSKYPVLYAFQSFFLRNAGIIDQLSP